MDVVSDKVLLTKVNQRIERSGSGGQNHVKADVRRGDVTLTGMLQFEISRSSIVKQVSAIAGVRRVIDQMKVEVKKKTW